MKLTPAQERAYDVATRSREPITWVAGFAGVGKTEILAKVARESGCDVLAPTNKAAIVLKRKGIKRAKTLHSALYAPLEIAEDVLDHRGEPVPVLHDDGRPMKKHGEPVYLKKYRLSFGYRDDDERPSTALVDEGSMLRQEQVDDLLMAYERVVVFGDPFQLPPVGAADVFGTIKHDVFLDEVHRTALDSPITRYATALRRSENAEREVDGQTVIKVPTLSQRGFSRLVEKDYQLICWTNALRHQLNGQYRRVLGHSGPPEVGERLIAMARIGFWLNLDESEPIPHLEEGWLITRDHHRSDGSRDVYIQKAYNGQEAVITAMDKAEVHGHSPYAHSFGLEASWGRFNPVCFWHPEFGRATKNPDFKQRTEGWDQVNFAYAITAHKAQGSEWDRVAVWDQRRIMRKDAARWFYTAVTRAKEKLVLVG